MLEKMFKFTGAIYLSNNIEVLKPRDHQILKVSAIDIDVALERFKVLASDIFPSTKHGYEIRLDGAIEKITEWHQYRIDCEDIIDDEPYVYTIYGDTLEEAIKWCSIFHHRYYRINDDGISGVINNIDTERTMRFRVRTIDGEKVK